MSDLTGDTNSEVILDTHTMGTWKEYTKPVVGHQITVYRDTDKGWKFTHLKLCKMDQAGVGDGLVRTPTLRLDMLWANGHAVNFFNTACFSQENTVVAPSAALAGLQDMAPKLADIPLAPSSRPMPKSLVTALYRRAVVLPWASEPPFIDASFKPAYQGLPPCFVAHTPQTCMAMVTDIDHDGQDDVVILDREVRQDASTWRLATLLMLRQGRWTVIANNAVCAEKGQKLEDLKIEFRPAAWRPIEFAGRLYLPDDPSDNCHLHYMLP